jgi:hypothetical protein
MGCLYGTDGDYEKKKKKGTVALHFSWILNNIVSNLNTLDPLRSNYLASTA